MSRILAFIFFFLTHLLFGQHTVRYIANEGIFLQSGEHGVLIDALFDDYYEHYHHPPKSLVENILNRNSPFEHIDLLLSTHVHRDHFYSKMVAEFLAACKNTSFIGTTQAADSLMKQPSISDDIRSRVIGCPKEASWHSINIKSLRVSSLYVRHGGRQNYHIDNLVFLLEFNGKKILHLGDSEMDIAHFSKTDFSSQEIDLALIPYWFLVYSPGIEIINRKIRPKKIIAIHYPKIGDPKSLKKIRGNFPDAVVFMKIGEQMKY